MKTDLECSEANENTLFSVCRLQKNKKIISLSIYIYNIYGIEGFARSVKSPTLV